MVLFNYSTRELTAKIVYYGPGLCGKTTNLQYTYESLPDKVKKGKMLSLATKTDRTLFFDFLPLDLGTIRGMKTRVQLYTVPGQVFYNSTRKLVLKGADGIVFVADSQAKMLEANVESYKNLDDNLREQGMKLEEIPLVMQFNKRDLPNLASIEEMNTQINRHNAPFYEAVATTGIGVEDTLKAITKLVLNNLAARYRLEAAPQPADTASPPARGAPATQASKPAAAPAPAPIPVSAEPEDLALEALDGPAPARPEEPPPAPRPVTPPARPAPPRPAPLRAVPPPESDDVFDLDEEIDLPALEEPADGSVDLGQDLLQELGDEPAPIAPPASTRPSTSRPGPTAAGRQAAPVALDEPLDLEPIDLGEDWETPREEAPDAAAPAGEPIDLGGIAPGQDRTLEVPLTATVDGRPVRFTLRLTVRLTR